MPVTINGSTGISSPGGDTSTSLSTGLLTVTGSTVPANGMYLPTTNTIAWATNSSEKLRLDASGNMGLGVTPSGWTSTNKTIQIGAGGAIIGRTDTVAAVNLGANYYYDGSNNRYIGTNYSSIYAQSNGQHQWFTAPSGTAGNAISFTQAMTLDASGNLGIGTTNPTQKLDVQAVYANITPATGTLPAAWLAANTGGSIYFGLDNSTGSNFNTSTAYAGVIWRSGANPICFVNNGSERARIDSSGNLLVGTTSASAKLYAYQTDNQVALIGEATNASFTDNVIYARAARNTTNGSFKAFAYYNTGASAYKFYVIDSGAVYSTSTSITSISDASLKENIRPLETGLAEVLALKPRRFDWKNGDGAGIAGFIAQEVIDVLPDLVSDYKYNDEETKKGLKMGDMIPTLVKAIQELTQRLEALEAK